MPPASPTSGPALSPQGLPDVALRTIRESHPLFRPSFTSDDWVENHGVFSLTEAAITLAVAAYRTQLEDHNTDIDGKVRQQGEMIAGLEKILSTLIQWDKPRRGVITGEIHNLKTNRKDTKSQKIHDEIDDAIAQLQKELKDMTDDRDQKNAIETKIAALRTNISQLKGKKITTQNIGDLRENITQLLSDIAIHPVSSPSQPKTSPHPRSFWTPARVATLLA